MRIILTIAMAVLSFTLYADKWTSTISGIGETVDKSYYGTALISNGEISTVIDYLGMQQRDDYARLVPAVSRAFRHYSPPNYELVSHGNFVSTICVNGEVQKAQKWSQTLNTKEAYSKNVVEYPDAIVTTTAFVPMTRNMLVVKKVITPKRDAKIKFLFKYNYLPSTRRSNPEVFLPTNAISEKNTARLQYKIFGLDIYKGETSICATANAKISFADNNNIALLESEFEGKANEQYEHVYFVCFNDNYNSELNAKPNAKYLDEAKLTRNSALNDGFNKIFDEHKTAWAKYWQAIKISIPDKKIEKSYYTGLYHLRCISTKWGFPVGLFAGSHWGGSYFGWDESFISLALVSSGLFDTAKLSVDYRKEILPVALHRAAHLPKKNRLTTGARYTWETYHPKFAHLEKSPGGYWLEHIFNMSNIALEAWAQYQYTNDLEYLKNTVYPIVSECAAFYLSGKLYETKDGKLIVAYCTDLERLGPNKLNAFMTSCGIIYTLEKAAEGAKILGIDHDFAQKCQDTAKALRASLPNDGTKYIPYENSKDKSINVCGGLFPYPVIDPNDKLQKNAVYDFFKNIKKVGNMYNMGKSVNAWYAAWTIGALVPYFDSELPAQMLSLYVQNLGVFGDTFEINEPENKVQMHPWFSTAAGNMVYSINKILLYNTESGEIRIAPAIPKSWKDFSYTLPCYGALSLSLDVRGGKIKSIKLISKELAQKNAKRVIAIPEHFVDTSKIIGDYKIEKGIVRIEVQADKDFYKN